MQMYEFALLWFYLYFSWFLAYLNKAFEPNCIIQLILKEMAKKGLKNEWWEEVKRANRKRRWTFAAKITSTKSPSIFGKTIYFPFLEKVPWWRIASLVGLDRSDKNAPIKFKHCAYYVKRSWVIMLSTVKIRFWATIVTCVNICVLVAVSLNLSQFVTVFVSLWLHLLLE